MPLQESPAMQRAREAYDRGRALFQTGQWGEALAAFREAYAAQPHPTVLQSIAECQDRLGEPRAAVATFEQYLRESPDARDRASVEARIAEIRARPASLHVTSDPSGARIEVDGADTDRTTPADLELTPGAHALRLELEGHVAREERLTLEYAERRNVDLALQVEAAPPRPELPPPPVRRPRPRSMTSTWVAAGVTGAALITAGVLGALTLSTHSDYEAGPTYALAKRGDELALGTDVALGVALAAGLTTLFAWAGSSGTADVQR
jgi:tetratricopeptide (TPR) repeat protein